MSIIGDVSGYIFDMGEEGGTDKGSFRFEGLHVTNFGGGQRGGIRVNHGVNCVVRDCSLECNRPVTFLNCTSSEVSNCFLRPGVLSPVELGTGPGRSTPGTIGIFTGSEPTTQTGGSVNTAIRSVDINGFESGIRIQGACSVRNARVEMCSVGIEVGLTETGGEYASGAILEGLEMEANGVHIRVVGSARISTAGLAADQGFSGDATDGRESRIGMAVAPGSQVVADLVVVYGPYRDAGIKFEGHLVKSVFVSIDVQPEPSPPLGSVPWRGINSIGAGNATFIQCNQPPA
jgi:hypothetical protein